jgi:hypothetical protein
MACKSWQAIAEKSPPSNLFWDAWSVAELRDQGGRTVGCKEGEEGGGEGRGSAGVMTRCHCNTCEYEGEAD